MSRRLFLKLLALFPILRRIFAPAPEVVIDTMPDLIERRRKFLALLKKHGYIRCGVTNPDAPIVFRGGNSHDRTNPVAAEFGRIARGELEK